MFLQMGGHGDCITQARKIRIVTNYPLPMQVDGEPVLLQPSEKIIEHKNQANMILASEENKTNSPAVQISSCTC